MQLLLTGAMVSSITTVSIKLPLVVVQLSITTTTSSTTYLLLLLVQQCTIILYFYSQLDLL